ncbi:FAD-dependent monooxygenase [Thiotrichales bacterium 19X7-9]|nr:FAD-dependent monooxygenase [Thiotrichales bacterium 19X7-9]
MRILIVGAGIAGLSMARVLRKNGLDAMIIEKETTLTQSGSGIALPANATSAMEYMGLKSQLMNIAHQVKEIIYAKPSGKVLSQASLLEGDLAYSEFVALHRKDLLNLLYSDELNVRFGVTVSELENRQDEVYTKLSNGEEHTWDLVIAADGIYSKTREFCFGPRALKKFDIINWRFIANLDTSNVEPIYYLGKNTLFMIYPISSNQVYCYAHLCNPESKHTDNPKATLLEHFKSYTSIVSELINQVKDEDIVCSQLQSVPEITYYKNRVAFIGDASNACSPILQQGAAAAFEDAIILANKLKTLPIDQALEQYQAVRLPRVSWIVDRSDKPLEKILNNASWLTVLLRNAFIRKHGPINIQGWRALFKENPIEELMN